MREDVPEPESPREHFEQGALTPQERMELKKAVEQFKASGSGITGKEFSQRPELERQQDAQEVAMLQKEFARHTTRGTETSELLGAALEMVCVEFAGSWFPMMATKASAYDDYKNKVDFVLEREDEHDRKLRIAVDVTARPESAREKIADIMENLYRGTLTKLKYFQSELDESTDVKYVPRVVIGTDERELLTELFRLYLNYQKVSDATERRKLLQHIAAHPLGREFLGQILIQLIQSIKALQKAPADTQPAEKIEALQAMVAALSPKNNTALAHPLRNAQGRNGVFSVIVKHWATA